MNSFQELPLHQRYFRSSASAICPDLASIDHFFFYMHLLDIVFFSTISEQYDFAGFLSNMPPVPPQKELPNYADSLWCTYSVSVLAAWNSEFGKLEKLMMKSISSWMKTKNVSFFRRNSVSVLLSLISYNWFWV